MHSSSFVLSAFWVCLRPNFVTAQNQCPPLGPVLPAPQNPSTNKAVQTVVEGINQQLGELTSTYNTTALSLGILSIYEDAPMVNYHYTPKLFNTSGTHNVTIDTVYRLASVSKMYTALAILQLSDKIDTTDPVTKYVPELAELDKQQAQVNDITTVRWAKITVDALLSHLSGISEDLGDEDLANTPGPWVSLGFPALTSGDKAMCGATPTQRACTRADFFHNFGKKHPVYAPYTTPLYSNNGFAILGFIIEAVTNKSYIEYMQEAVFKPLGLNHTTVGVPSNSSVGFIPAGSSWWSTDIGFDNPSGGLYASTRDLLSIGKSVLTFEALSPVATRQWLKPATFTSSIGSFVGRPWEIARSDNVTSDKRVVDFYTKSGNLYDYSSIVVLIPDYGIVMTVASAGPDSGSFQIQGIVTQLVWALLPAIEAAGKAEAQPIFPGTYQAGTEDNVTARITVVIDDGPGLHVTNYTSRGHDIIAEYAQLTGSPIPEVRMYPTDLLSTNSTSQQVAWRAVYNSIKENAAVDSQLFFAQGSCQTWSIEDVLSYGLTALDDFVFTLGPKGQKAESIDARALRTTLQKID